MAVRKVDVTRSAAALAICIAATGCGGDDPGTGGRTDPAPESTPAEAGGSTTDDELSSEEGGVFREALRRYDEYRSRSAPIMAKGRATPASAAVFEEYFVDWRAQQQQLASLEQNGITFRGSVTVAWSRPAEVADASVAIEQCVVEEATALQDGVELPPAGPETPYLVTTVMTRSPATGEFQIESSASEDARCDPSA